MRCPHCGLVQIDAPLCRRCGKTQARPAMAARQRTRADRVRRLVRGATALVLFAGFAAFAWWWFRASAPPRPTPEASSVPTVHGAPRAAAASAAPSTAEIGVAPLVAATTATPGTPATCPLLSVASPYAPSRAPVPRDWLVGAEGFEALGVEQRRGHAPGLVYFYTDWCPYCRRLDRELLQSSDVERFFGNEVVRVRINPELGSAEREVANRFGITGYPRLFLLLEGENVGALSPYEPDTEQARLLAPDAFIRVIEEHVSRWVETRLTRAADSRRRRDRAEAQAVLDTLAEVRPKDTRIYVQRGLVRADRGDLPGALEDLRRASDLAPEDVGPFDALHEILGRDSRWDEAVACWSLLLERVPANGQARFGRGAAYSQKGDREHALEDLREACRLGEAQACEAVRRAGDETQRAGGS